MRQSKGWAVSTVSVIGRRRTKAFKYSYDARKVLQTVWVNSGGLCGKYLAASMMHLGCPRSSDPPVRENIMTDNTA